MTPEQFDSFVTQHPEISWTPARMVGERVEGVDISQATGLAFKVKGLAWYDDPNNVSFIPKERTGSITPEELAHELTQGLEMDHITRITGYFTKVSSWNKGKLGELTDRYRNQSLS